MLFDFSLRRIYIVLILNIILFFSSVSKADVDIRISDVSALTGSGDVSYVASISSCGELIAIEAGTSTQLDDYTNDDIVYDTSSPSQCYLHFTLSGASRFTPAVGVTYQDIDKKIYTESFVYEDVSPQLSFKSASIVGETNKQNLVIEVEASDNQDIAYISFDVVGLSASALRNSGGVVAEAKEGSFASTGVAQRIYPSSNSQTIFQLSLPLNKSLSAEEIAFDTIILSDITVVDASGNHSSISKLAFTGDSIEESANALIVSNTPIVISNALQTPTIIPSIEFQFRGVVSLPGAGNGITYSSSHPELIDVTPAGVIYALKETEDEQVFITVSYSGLESVLIPVEADFSKKMVGITLAGVDVDTPLTLPSLNAYYTLPEMVGVFDDGSRTSISGHWTPVITINPTMAAFLETNKLQQIKSSVIISESSEYGLRLSLKELPTLFANIRVQAIDSVPSIELDVPSTIFYENDLLVSAVVTDDIGISQVEFFLDDAIVGTVTNPPYVLTLPLSSQLEGRTLKLTSKAIDTAGQSTLSIDYTVTVEAPAEVKIPEYSFVKPFDGQRIVESSPLNLQIETSLGILPNTERASGINRVEFLFDGQKIGEANFPGFEVRDAQGSEDQEMFETWSFNANVPSISTNETSLSVGAIIYTNAGQEAVPSKLLRVVKNIAPQINIMSPSTGGIATVGQKLPITVEIIDESLVLGASIEILLEDKVIASTRFFDDSLTVETVTTQSVTQHFSYDVTAEDVGSTLKLQAKVIDFHQSTALSPIVRIPVKNDQPPTVALSNPTAGASFVSGLPIQLRANAVDDIKIDRVDFYVNSQLVGSDHIPPYAHNYETQKELVVEQRLTIHSIAIDSAGQEAVSNSVEVTLGQDEESPVVNISSPFISATDAGDDIAGVIAQSEFVFKVTGFDNVGANRAEVKGIKRDGSEFILTGNAEDILTGADFPVQKLPGVLNAYSALKLTRVPEYQNKTAADYDRYPVSVTVFDETDNYSTANIIIGVYPDEPPQVASVTTNNSIYFINDTVNVQIQANDDRAVSRVEVSYQLNGNTLSSHSFTKDNGLVPMPILQVSDSLNLSELALINEEQTIIIKVVAYDQLGQASSEFESEVRVTGDSSGPIATLNDPLPGSILYAGDLTTFSLRAIDESGLQQIKVLNNDVEVSVFNFNEPPKEANKSFNFTIPSNESTLTFTLVSKDLLGNITTLNQSYEIEEDVSPTISIRHPAAGSRLIEGESFTINALISDNRSIKSAEIFIEHDGKSSFSKTFSTKESNFIVSSGKYFSATLRVPNKPDSGTLKVGVRAQDNAGLTVEELLDLEIIDDPESPIINLSQPKDDLSLYAGEAFELSGVASDDIYIKHLTPILVKGSEEIQLSWEVLTREDRLEQIRVANTDSFGSVVAAERFYSDYSGRIRIPEEMLARAGETFDFQLRAADNGINTSESNSIKITIRQDDEVPEIEFTSPSKKLFEGQTPELAITIRDNISVDKYRVVIVDDESREVLSASNLAEKIVKINNADVIDLSRYYPVSSDGKKFTVIAHAEDSSGNKSSETLQVNLLPNEPPTVQVVSQIPENTLTYGATQYTRLKVSDDYVAHSSSNQLSVLYTSLEGLHDVGDRNLVNDVLDTPTGEINRFNFNYPESGSLSGSLKINEDDYWIFTEGKSQFLAYSDAQVQSLQFLIDNYSVSYIIDVYSDDLCSPGHTQYQITSSDLIETSGILNVASYQSKAGRIVVTPTIDGVADDQQFLQQIHISFQELPNQLEFTDGEVDRRVNTHDVVKLLVNDRDNSEQKAFLSQGHSVVLRKPTEELSQFFPSLADPIFSHIYMFAAARDNFSLQRPAQKTQLVSTFSYIADEEDPSLTILSPVDGSVIVPGQTIEVIVKVTDDTQAIGSISLSDNVDYSAEITGEYQKDDEYVFHYTAPHNQSGGEIHLAVTSTDFSGRSSASTVALPIDTNQAPQLKLLAFSSYKVFDEGSNSDKYQKVIDEPERVNYGEFWVRSGEDFELSSELSDDAGLVRYQIKRFNRDGSSTIEVERGFVNQCPVLPLLTTTQDAEIQFNEVEPTEYEVLVEDNSGKTTTRRFIVHPVTNVTPEVRITTPSEGQFIVAGTFQIEVGLLAADDRKLSTNDIQIYANGVELNLEDIGTSNATDASYQQALDSIYDALEIKYSEDIAQDYARSTSDNLLNMVAVYNVPSGLIKYNENIILTAQVKDSDNAIGTSEVTFIGAADAINPEIAIINPTIGYGPPEFSDFGVEYRAYDNVKVEQLEFLTTYGVQHSDGTYQKLAYTLPLRTINDIRAIDHEPITTNNIDTVIYKQIVHVDRLSEIAALFESLSLADTERFDIWVKVNARDPSGNLRSRELSFPVRIDERPVVDIVAPLDGNKVVELTPLLVNVNAYDDVGIDSLRLVALSGALGEEVEIYNTLLRQPPYNFSVAMPEFNTVDSAKNRVVFRVEAIDTYGSAFGDLDKHTALETIVVEVIEDIPPEVIISSPNNGDDPVIEGNNVLVQINAIDDVAIDRVTLNVANLINGDRTFTDVSYPYEFFLNIPYGQAGSNITLSASATEQRSSGTKRTVQATQSVVLDVIKDTEPPVFTRIVLPADTGTTVAEKHSFPYQFDVTDNVSVSSVRLELFVDGNNNGQFELDEKQSEQLLIASPYIGNFNVQSIKDYYQGHVDNFPNQLDMQLVIYAQDGAGNESSVNKPITLVKNSPPEVTDIKILDQRGNNLGLIAEITQGREFVVDVTANDPESGIDSITLYQLVGEGDDDAFEIISTDGAAPFQFNLSAPIDNEGEILNFRATAVDLDGNVSELSAIRSLTIVEDKPPTASIITPVNNAVVIDGQSINIQVEALDDLGANGIDRVVFYLNNKPVYTAYQNSDVNENYFAALIEPPVNVDGFAIQAIAYDVLNQAGSSSVIQVGRIDDTVAPTLSVLAPFNNDILTSGEQLIAAVSITDIGIESERRIYMTWIREYQNETGTWITLNNKEIELFRDDNQVGRPNIPVSEPDNFNFIYWAQFSDGSILQRGSNNIERVRVETRVETPNHTVTETTIHEVGMPISERRFLAPTQSSGVDIAKSVYYSSVAQFMSAERDGAMVGSWSTHDPARFDNLTVASDFKARKVSEQCSMCTGLFLADFAAEQTDSGDILLYSELLNGASEIFSGTISEIYADENIVLATKHGIPSFTVDREQDTSFRELLEDEIAKDEDNGKTYYENDAGELLLFSTQNGDGQFGLPYLLAGRVDLPFYDVFGLAKKDDLVFVANGAGGVQVFNISNIKAPYRIGFVKPNGYARDVKISGDYAYIAASSEGVVVVNIADPNLPVIAVLDTLGVANRIQIVGNKLYVTDMSGVGRVSQLNIVNIHDPFYPVIEKSITIEPAREDLVSDGVYEVHVSGNKAYLSVHYSDQEDKQAQSVVEIVDLEQLDQPHVDASIPVMINRHASEDNFAVRDLTLARGAIQVAASKSGINRIELTELTVVDHSPTIDEAFVSTALNEVSIELSAIISHDANLTDFIDVYEGAVLADGDGSYTVGENISERFTFSFGERNGETAYRFITIKPKAIGDYLQTNQQYVVVVKSGLPPFTGNPLSRDYVYSFYTSPAGSQPLPDIQVISPDFGSIEGGEQMTIEGRNFGDSPAISLGGFPLVIHSVELAQAEGELDKIVATTIPNTAGPAAVKVTTSEGLEDTVFGAYTYLDILHISFITPAVVDVSQVGENDRVEVIGYGFNPDITLKAYPAGQPENAVLATVDQDYLSVTVNQGPLTLLTPQSMSWAVPDFGNNYRGYVDVEISDANGRFYYAPKALFYGNLSANIHINLEHPFTYGEMLDELSAIERGLGSTLSRDPSKLPAGKVVGLAVDSEIGLIYALGRGSGVSGGPQPSSVVDQAQFRQLITPSWLELIHYDRLNLENTAPMVGLGYFDLPQDLNASGLVLGESHLYVTAKGMHFPNIDTPYEDLVWLLAYDREDRLPGELTGQDAQAQSKDRDIKYSLPLPFNTPPSELLIKDKLLITHAGYEGLVIASISDPEQPSVIKHIKTFTQNGVERNLAVDSISIQNEFLSVLIKGKQATRVIYDLSQPGLPQIHDHSINGVRVLAGIEQQTATAFYQDGVSLLDDTNIHNPITERGYKANGFSLIGEPHALVGKTSLVANLNIEYIYDSQKQLICNKGYLTLFDISQNTDISIQDLSVLTQCNGSTSHAYYEEYKDTYKAPLVFSDDGLVVTISQADSGIDDVTIIDTYMLDLATSYPTQSQTGIGLDSTIQLNFTQPIVIPTGQTENQYLSRYLALIYDDASESGEIVEVTLAVDANNPRKVYITPNAHLNSDSSYRIQLQSEPEDGGRRATGLFDHTIHFSTGTGFGVQPTIDSIIPHTVETTGGFVKVVVSHSINPTFLIAQTPAAILSQTNLSDNKVEYSLELPANLAGAASLSVIEPDGKQATVFGAIQYTEPLVLESLSPVVGSIVGNTTVRVKGRGFKAGLGSTQVYVNNIQVSASNIKVIDQQNLEFITPPGQLGLSDVRVETLGQTETLSDAFTYLQPVKSNITGTKTDKLYDIKIEPTGTYAVAAAGNGGVLIINIDSSTFTANADDVTNVDELRHLIDKNKDSVDDRIISRIQLPDGYAALGVDLFFERNNDRLFITAAKIGSVPHEAQLFIVAIDSLDITQSTIVNQLPLNANFAKGIEVKNNQAIIAMGEKGVGIVDAYLHSKVYLTDYITLPHNKPALDVTKLASQAGIASRFAVAAGEFNFSSNRLIDTEVVGGGGFYIIERNNEQGLQVVSSLDIPSSKVVVDETNYLSPANQYAYLAAGELGVVIVDISDVYHPKVVQRIQTPAYDISLQGNILYVAQAELGITSFDVTDPKAPIRVDSFEAFNGSSIDVVLATAYSAIGAGADTLGYGVIQETPDAILKLHSIDPSNGILDFDTDASLKIRLRFNKAIDLLEENKDYFSVIDEDGLPISSRVDIINNDAIIYIESSASLEINDVLTVEAAAGIVASKPVLQDGVQINVELYQLESTQRMNLVYRGSRPDTISIDTVLPRRIQMNQAESITVSMLGSPLDTSRIRGFIGDAELTATSIESHSEDERISIITFAVPPITAAGLYDLNVMVEKQGIWQSASLYGALQVDQPIEFTSLSPLWGPLSGGTKVTILGKGFEPGNTVMDGLTVSVGSQPAREFRVISSTEIEMVTPRGASGHNNVYGQDRYGNRTSLEDEKGYYRKLVLHLLILLMFMLTKKQV